MAVGSSLQFLTIHNLFLAYMCVFKTWQPLEFPKSEDKKGVITHFIIWS